ncbi:PAS domain-containing protein [Haladaptatus salinisoli]|uniref:PAS domain-containing protein n=1 Tax=Haladaptatus salinisoli TaxID=2884876 RepID=UPI001D0AE969|nr:PAS domain S-box protein [Haladaptatus salinisoli]
MTPSEGDDASSEVAAVEDTVFRRLVQQTTDAVVIATSDGTIVFANRAVEDVFGYAPTALEGRELTTLIPERLRQRHRAAFERYVRTGERTIPWNAIELPGLRADGTEIPLSMSFHVDAETDDQRFIGVLRDVSDRKRIEHRLDEKTEHLDEVFDASPIALSIRSADGAVLRMNERAAELVDILSAAEDVADETRIYGPDGELLTAAELPFNRVVESGRPVHDVEFYVDGPTDERRWFIVNAKPVHGDDGTVTQVITAGKDITQVKRYQRALERQRDDLERELSEVFDRIDDAFYALDDEWRFTYVNERAEQLLGREESALLGRVVWETFPDSRGTRGYEAFHRAVETQERVTYEERWSPLDAWFEVHVYPSESGVSVYFRDITDRKEREGELKRDEAMLETVRDGVYALDDDGRFVAVNRAYADMTGYSRAELLGSKATMVTGEDAAAEFERAQAHLERSDEDVVTVEATLETVDGDYLPTEVRVSLFPLEDGRYGRVGVVRDITERKEREREIRDKNERLESFASMLAHELRNPLSIAKGYLGWAWEEGSESAYEEVDRAHDRMEEMIEMLLFMARGSAPVANREAVDLADAAADAWAAIDAETTDAATLDVATERVVHAEQTRIEQLLENLFRNAIEHGGEDVTVRVGDIDSTDDSARGFYVADDGAGISRTKRETVFEAGYTTRRDGIGLGLTFIAQIADGYGWTYAVTESEAGGARFEFTGLGPSLERR